jgi:hypothetical protein
VGFKANEYSQFFLVGFAGNVARLEMCNRQQRARLGHPVPSEHIDAALHRLLSERLWKGDSRRRPHSTMLTLYKVARFRSLGNHRR